MERIGRVSARDRHEGVVTSGVLTQELGHIEDFTVNGDPDRLGLVVVLGDLRCGVRFDG